MATQPTNPFAFSGFLLAMQAGGFVLDYRDYKNNQQLISMGRQLEQSQLNANLESIQAESGQQSLDSMRELRQNLGMQIAQNAARGTLSGQGSALTTSQQSISNFNQDERTRRLNLLSKEANLRGANVLSGLHTLQSETQLGQALTKRIFNTLPISTVADVFGKTSLGKKWGFGIQEVS